MFYVIHIVFFYLKPWPVSIFEDFPFSLYNVAASESDEGLVFIFDRKDRGKT